VADGVSGTSAHRRLERADHVDRHRTSLGMRVQTSNYYAIYRVDHDASHTHSWLVMLQRRGRIYHRHFSDRVHGGKRKALEVVKSYRIVSPQSCPQELCAIKKKNNRSGVSGVDVQE
jgi:hypothetical protein